MYQWLRRQLGIFLLGFVVAFVIYVWREIGGDDLLVGVIIGAASGVVLTLLLLLLERRFPEQIPGGDDAKAPPAPRP
jgi:hypothetical protein